jgi:hypothetical protein
MVIEMLETTDLFEKRIKECKDTAAKSANENDREFCLRWRFVGRACCKRDNSAVLALKALQNIGPSAPEFLQNGALLKRFFVGKST